MTLVGTIFLQRTNFIDACYIVAFSLFIYGLSGLTGPRTAVRGNMIAAVGMAIAIIGHAAHSARAERFEYAVADRAGIGHRDRGRGSRGAERADDRDAADGRDIQRRRRRRGGDHRVDRVPPPLRSRACRSGFEKSQIPTLFAAIVGSISFWGSNIAFGKLQEILPGRPIKLPGQIDHQRRPVRDLRRLRDHARGRHPLPGAIHHRDPAGRGRLGEHGRTPDRRRRHACRHLAAERVHRTVGRRHRDRAEQHRDDRRRDDRRRVRHRSSPT